VGFLILSKVFTTSGLATQTQHKTAHFSQHPTNHASKPRAVCFHSTHAKLPGSSSTRQH